MNIVRDIQTLSEFKQNASKLVKQMEETREPLVLTVNGKPVAVLQDVHSYQQLIDASEYQETVAALRIAVAEMEDPDNWVSSREAFAMVRAKYAPK